MGGVPLRHPVTHSTCLLCLQDLTRAMPMGKALHLSCGQMFPAPAWSTHLVSQVHWAQIATKPPQGSPGAILGLCPFLGPAN